MQPFADPTRAFRALERALVRRRLRSLEPLLRVEIMAIGALSAGFVFWQTRLPLAAAHARGGARTVLIEAGLRLLGLVLAAGALAGVAHGRALAGALSGPAWLSLPLPASRVHRHVAWASSTHALWVTPFAIGVLAAGTGLLPTGWLLLLAAAFVWATIEASRAGATIAFRLACRAAGFPVLDAATRVLAQATRESPKRRVPGARWRRLTPGQALMAKDARLATRPGPLRDRVPGPLLCAVASAALWALPLELGLAHVASFVLLLVAAGLWGACVIAACASDPPGLLRALPLGLRDVWGARARWALCGALGCSLLAVLAAVRVPASIALTEAVFMALAAAAIGGLAVNLGVSLFPRAAEAERLFALSVAIALAASLMIPLLGWVVLLVALFHSSRRVSRWSLPETI